MALITCPECGKEVSDKAKACPNCGCPIEEVCDKTIITIKRSKRSSNSGMLFAVEIRREDNEELLMSLKSFETKTIELDLDKPIQIYAKQKMYFKGDSYTIEPHKKHKLEATISAIGTKMYLMPVDNYDSD